MGSSLVQPHQSQDVQLRMETEDCVLFGRSTSFYVFLQHASAEAQTSVGEVLVDESHGKCQFLTQLLDRISIINYNAIIIEYAYLCACICIIGICVYYM